MYGSYNSGSSDEWLTLESGLQRPKWNQSCPCRPSTILSLQTLGGHHCPHRYDRENQNHPLQVLSGPPTFLTLAHPRFQVVSGPPPVLTLGQPGYGLTPWSASSLRHDYAPELRLGFRAGFGAETWTRPRATIPFGYPGYPGQVYRDQMNMLFYYGNNGGRGPREYDFGLGGNMNPEDSSDDETVTCSLLKQANGYESEQEGAEVTSRGLDLTLRL